MTTAHGGGCREIFAQLSAYLDLELPPDACEQLEAHLADCPPCVEFVNSLRETIHLCRGYRPSELPSKLTDSTRKSLFDAYQRALKACSAG